MDIETLAKQANTIISGIDYDLKTQHGLEIEEGFFTLFNTHTGQCKAVLYHVETDLVFKRDYDPKPRASKRYLSAVEIDGIQMWVRLPEYRLVTLETGDTITAQEYIHGENCGCSNYDCEHAIAVSDATGCQDAHTGNWKIATQPNGDKEIILFDYEGTQGIE